jgi:hypothetical protein
LDARVADAIEVACENDGATFLGLGLFPGIRGESVASVLSRPSQSVTRISVREVINYASYASTDLMFNTMGLDIYRKTDPTARERGVRGCSMDRHDGHSGQCARADRR